MNNHLTFVSCIYDDLYETEFGGRPHPARKYLYGLESAFKTNSPFVIFTWPKDVDRIKNSYINFLGEDEFNKRIKVLPYDLYDTPIREIIKREKPKHNIPGDRCHDVMFGKFLMIKKAISENFFNSEKFFWIDAGLSSSDLFPNKFLDRTNPEKQYSWCNLFTPKLSNKLIELSSTNILLFKMNGVGHWISREHLYEEGGVWYIIGGIFGGNKTDMNIFCDKILNSFIYHIDEYSVLYFEEPIMTIIYSFNKDDYNILEFDVWAHEDSGEWVQPLIKNKKNFYKLFENINFDVE
jgi:hypothetical protein